MIPSPSEVMRTLDLLGTTPTAVAQTLAAKGIHGARNKNDACPVAVFLREQFPGTNLFVVGPIVAYEDQDVSIETTPAIAGFVDAFDDGDFPELES